MSENIPISLFNFALDLPLWRQTRPPVAATVYQLDLLDQISHGFSRICEILRNMDRRDSGQRFVDASRGFVADRFTNTRSHFFLRLHQCLSFPHDAK
jgi:hypothetical protein